MLQILKLKKLYVLVPCMNLIYLDDLKTCSKQKNHDFSH